MIDNELKAEIELILDELQHEPISGHGVVKRKKRIKEALERALAQLQWASECCPYCDRNLVKPSVSQIIELLNQENRRSIYEIGGADGKGTDTYTITYGNDKKMPVFNRVTAEAVAATGIIKEDPTCRGYFHRTPTEDR